MAYQKLSPKKSLGQNFLKDENIARKIVTSLALKADDKVLEIGPGTGMLTKYIVPNAGKFIAVEIDNNLAPRLRKEFSKHANFELVHEDILKIDFENILSNQTGWKVAANLPYHITSPVLFKLFENKKYFHSATMMIQKEVAQRVVAEPGSKTYGILSVFSQYHSFVELLFDVSKNVFFPVPDVTSAVVQWQFKHEEILSQAEESLFRRIVKHVFGQRRKMLRKSLISLKDLNIDLLQINFDFTKRPEELSVTEFIQITKQIYALLKL